MKRDDVVIVTGGRAFKNREGLHRYLDRVHAMRPIRELWEGGASGADQFAREWALENGVKVRTVQAAWAEHGRAAGPMRNAYMVTHANPFLVIACPGGNGTAHAVETAKRHGLKVVELRWIAGNKRPIETVTEETA